VKRKTSSERVQTMMNVIIPLKMTILEGPISVPQSNGSKVEIEEQILAMKGVVIHCGKFTMYRQIHCWPEAYICCYGTMKMNTLGMNEIQNSANLERGYRIRYCSCEWYLYLIRPDRSRNWAPRRGQNLGTLL
jgi:hypothetical protein